MNKKAVPTHPNYASSKCWHVILIYRNVEWKPNVFSSCIASISNMFALKTYYSTFIVESNGFGCITVFISLKNRVIVNRLPGNFVFDNINPSIYGIAKRSRPSLNFLVGNFKDTDVNKKKYFLTNSDMFLAEFLKIN